MRRELLHLTILAACCATLAGCQSIPYPNIWPFPERGELTTYHTPSMRADAISQFSMRSTGVDSPEQRQITDQLARQIQIEPDPLIRQAVVRSIAEFRTPMSQQVLESGLADENAAVLEKISSIVQETESRVVEISEYSAEQTRQIQEISLELCRMNDAVTESASIARKTAQAYEKMAQSSLHMDEVLGRFKIR